METTRIESPAVGTKNGKEEPSVWHMLVGWVCNCVFCVASSIIHRGYLSLDGIALTKKCEAAVGLIRLVALLGRATKETRLRDVSSSAPTRLSRQSSAGRAATTQHIHSRIQTTSTRRITTPPSYFEQKKRNQPPTNRKTTLWYNLLSCLCGKAKLRFGLLDCPEETRIQTRKRETREQDTR